MGTFQKFCLRWNNHTTNLLGTLGHILSSEQHTDVTLCCQGEVWRLHKLVLCASSSHFEKLLGALPPGQSPIVVLDGPHPQDVASLIQFIYHGEVNVDQENLASLLRTAESLKIKGLAEVSSVTSSSAEHKNQIDGESQRHASRSRSRPNSCQPTPIYTLGSEYPVGMYSLVTQAISPQTQIVPDHVERDPSPLNLSFSQTLKNIHDETPQERQERRNRLDNLLYAATERSKKEERREARREAREAALREAAAMREASVMVTQDTSVLPPVAKRPRVSEGSQNNTLPAHPAFHIPVMNLTLPSGAATSFVTSHSTTTTQTQPVVYEAGPHVECHSIVSQQEPMQEQQEVEVVSSKSPVKTERIEVLSDTSAIEEVAVHSDESDTQSAPETPSDLTTPNRARATTPVPTCTTTATQVSLSSSCAIDDVSSSSAYTTPASTATPTSATNTVSVSPQSESGEEKVPPYFHTILRQVAEGNSNGEAVSTNAQRVTINMRTFKEEWRRQLLVDYNTRTNMSICMLCFTTFKSYDGPRKNTYVKHAKRFHPSLEEYSEEERDLIISMYEKYHKYDVDMQKEVNKSYRAANAIVALGKKGAKHNEATAEIPTTTGTNGVTTKQEMGSNIAAAKPETVEPEAHDDRESAAENINVKEEDVATSSACKSLSHSSEIEVSSEGNDKGTETNEEPREKVNNNNVAVAPQMKRSQMNTRAKTATATTVSV
ncbi:longitudinals lacking protein, isoforms H/M/V-like isoform X2 [Palaemon carinicauda]|uniref:longitudinals lacking protein, isoforms H/M/V-like isoform X2 n=1 Tax=Palaemon carinicauda TaxID=392227 RepID=UPI0035B5E7B3